MSLKKPRSKRNYKKIVKISSLILILFISSVVFFFLNRNRGNIMDSLRSAIDKDPVEEVSGAAIVNEVPAEICISDNIDETLQVKISEEVDDLTYVSDNLDEGVCAIHLTRSIDDSNKYDSLWSKLYVPVARYDESITDLTQQELTEGIKAQFSDSYGFIWSRQDSRFINSKFDIEIEQIFPTPEDVVEKVESEKGVIGLIPIRYLSPKLKIISVDGIYPYDEDLSIYSFPLVDMIWISENFEENNELTIAANKIEKEVKNWEVADQYDPYGFEYVVLTGKSAVGAKQYFTKQQNNPNFNPLKPIESYLKDASFAHMSNISSFSERCEQTDQTQFFCGTPDSLTWLSGAGIDLVGLTGDHIMDYDRNEFRKTLDLYINSNIRYFGGGETRDEAELPVNKQVGSTKISFLGYSLITPTKYIATNRLAGNLAADLNYPGDAQTMIEGLRGVPEDTDITIVEMQWGDYEGVNISVAEQEYAQLAAREGADIIIGTTSDKIKDIEFVGDTLVLYGMGNFLYHDGGKRDNEGLILELLFYKGEYVGYLLKPVIISDDLNVTLADVDKKAEILNTVY